MAGQQGKDHQRRELFHTKGVPARSPALPASPLLSPCFGTAKRHSKFPLTKRNQIIICRISLWIGPYNGKSSLYFSLLAGKPPRDAFASDRVHKGSTRGVGELFNYKETLDTTYYGAYFVFGGEYSLFPALYGGWACAPSSICTPAFMAPTPTTTATSSAGESAAASLACPTTRLPSSAG